MPPGTSTFVDTNVLLYAHDLSESVKRPIALAWLERLWAESSGRLSSQVLNEFYWNVRRKLPHPLGKLKARDTVSKYFDWQIAVDAATTARAAWILEDRFQLAWWDALVVAAAQRAGCVRLLTEDLQDGQRFDDVLVVDPFRHTPDEVFDGDAGEVAEPSPARRGARPRRHSR